MKLSVVREDGADPGANFTDSTLICGTHVAPAAGLVDCTAAGCGIGDGVGVGDGVGEGDGVGVVVGGGVGEGPAEVGLPPGVIGITGLFEPPPQPEMTMTMATTNVTINRMGGPGENGNDFLQCAM